MGNPSNILFLFAGLILGLFLGLYFSGSDPNKNSFDFYENRIKALEKKLNEKDVFLDLLNQELTEINSSLDEINKDQFFEDSLILDPVIKLNRFDSLLQKSSERILELEDLAKKRTSNADVRLLNSVISDLKNKLLVKEHEIRILKTENDSLKATTIIQSDSIVDLTIRKNELTHEIKLQKQILEKVSDSLTYEKSLLENEKKTLVNDLAETKEQIRIEKMESYFNIAMELLNEYENTSSGFLQSGKKQMRGQLITKAYTYFRKACLLGHTNAAIYIKRIITLEKYNSLLEIDQSGSSLTKCGI